jgi:histone-lysine N-methyltransferase SETMAR
VVYILREQPFSSTKYIAAQLRTSRDLVKKTVVEVLRIKRFNLRWVPRELTVAQKRQRVADSRRLLQTLIADTPKEFTNIITADESWYYWFCPPTFQWRTSRDLVPTRPLQKIDSRKSMFALIFSDHGLSAFDKLPKECKMNSQCFCDVVLEDAKRSVVAIMGKSGIEGLMIQTDNCKVHNSGMTSQRLEEFQVIRLAHPPYSPDISPCDFWFVGSSKDMMKCHQFQSADDIRAFLIDFWGNFDQSTPLSISEGWIARLEEVIATNGEYYSPQGI